MTEGETPTEMPTDPKVAAEALRKAELDNRKVELEIEKTEQELAAATSTSAKAQKAAENAKAIAVAQKDAAEARQAQVAALIPDLSKVARGTSEITGDEPLFGSSLAHRALRDAAQIIATTAAGAIDTPAPAGDGNGDVPGGPNVLVTTEEELATSDAIYHDVMNAIDELISAGGSARTEPQGGGVKSASFVLPALGAAAQAIPGVISLLSAHRKVSSRALTIENLAAAAATAGALQSEDRIAAVVHDDFRLLPQGTVHARVAALAGERRELIARKLELDSEKAIATTDLAVEKATIGDLEQQLPGGTDRQTLQTQLEQHRRTAAGHEQEISTAGTRIALIDAVVAAIDEFSGALRIVPEGGRSPLATAALREQLHATPSDGENDKPIDPYFSHVVLVNANPGSAHQVVEDRLLRKDKFTVVAIVNVAYMLIATSDSHVVAAGNASAKATGHGKIGESFDFPENA